MIRDFSNQNAGGNVSKISVNHTDDIPCKEMFRFTTSEIQNMGLTSRAENHSNDFEFTLASVLFVCAWIQDVARLLRVGREKGSEYLPK